MNELIVLHRPDPKGIPHPWLIFREHYATGSHHDRELFPLEDFHRAMHYNNKGSRGYYLAQVDTLPRFIDTTMMDEINRWIRTNAVFRARIGENEEGAVVMVSDMRLRRDQYKAQIEFTRIQNPFESKPAPVDMKRFRQAPTFGKV